MIVDVAVQAAEDAFRAASHKDDWGVDVIYPHSVPDIARAVVAALREQGLVVDEAGR